MQLKIGFRSKKALFRDGFMVVQEKYSSVYFVFSHFNNRID